MSTIEPPELAICPCAASQFGSEYESAPRRAVTGLGRAIAIVALSALTVSTTRGAASDVRDMTVPPCCRGPAKEGVVAIRRREKRPQKDNALDADLEL